MDRDEPEAGRFTDQGETIYDLLWLQTPCCGHVLWACNTSHLASLDRFVRATLRERIVSGRNRSIASRLPDWIKSGVHRDDVLAGIGRLYALLKREELGNRSRSAPPPDA